MTLFPIDWLGVMFLFCSYGVKSTFHPAAERLWGKIPNVCHDLCRGDLPVGQIFENPVQPSRKKYLACPVGQIKSKTPPVPRSSRGAFRDRHER
jgi:hypothetical protein